MATEMQRCPICGGAVKVPPLDDLALALINDHGLSEDAEGFLRLLWPGEIVKTTALLGALYEDAPDDEPGLMELYRQARAAIAELRAALAAEGSGIDVREAGWRLGYRLHLPAALSA